MSNGFSWTLYFEQRPHLLNKGDQEHKITPLMLAVIFGKQSFVKALLDLKADVDLETEGTFRNPFRTILFCDF